MPKCSALLAIVLASLSAVAQSSSTLTFSYTQLPDGPSPCVGGNRANGINQRGDIAGRCLDSNGPRSWLLLKGSTTPVFIDFTSAPFGAQVHGSTTRAINDAGDVVGRWFDIGGVSHGYLLSNGVFTDIETNFTGAVDTDLRGINDAGTSVGFYHVMQNVQSLGIVPIPHGFVRDARGNFTQIDFPGALGTLAHGINSTGDVVGAYIVLDSTVGGVGVHGFLLSKGVYTPLDYPAATASEAFGINEEGQIAGAYTTQTVTVQDLLKEQFITSHGFVRSADGSTFTAIDFPAALSTACRGGINDHGNIVGAIVVDSAGTEYGFVTSR